MKRRSSHHPPWASDNGETGAVPVDWPDVSLITEMEKGMSSIYTSRKIWYIEDD